MVMEALVKAVHWLFPDFAFMWLVEEAKKNMPLELDFLNEGHNAERVASLLSHFPFLKVPMIHWDLSTKRILTMEFVEGGQVDDRDYMKKHNIDVNKISENLDMSGVERYSRRLGAGDLFPLFACVLTARSWNAVNSGISSAPVTQAEDVEIRTNAARYLPQISDLLNRVPRQMLLLLKTNDLLRGIETTLQTRASSSSFINMSRCCVRAVARHKRSKARSRSRRLQITLTESLSLWKLSVYELLLWFRGSMMNRWLAAILAFLH
uniref:AarF domain-containing protein kinase 1 n=1 Tax=Nothobranchius korthausae TaxID=1143690 RepID=A0A1A8HIP6_9TELE